MTDRKKLIDIIVRTPCVAVSSEYAAEHIIDHLLANGVHLETKEATSDENKRWIPVTERLPEDDSQVLACTRHGKAFSAHYDHKWKSWSVSHTVKITHWMPLPEPPKEDANDA